MTREERHLWFDFLRDYPIRFRRQEIIGHYIADFYCSEAKLIVDIDVLNDETVFKGIVSACGVDYSAIRTAYTDIVSNLHSSKEIVKRAIAKAAINQILDNGKSTNLTNREIKDIR